MGKHFDELSKAFASGASRRSALKRFAAGVAGAALASVLPGRSAEAQSEPSECQEHCRDLSLRAGVAFVRCMRVCAPCVARGGTFVVGNASLICI